MLSYAGGLRGLRGRRRVSLRDYRGRDRAGGQVIKPCFSQQFLLGLLNRGNRRIVRRQTEPGSFIKIQITRQSGVSLTDAW